MLQKQMLQENRQRNQLTPINRENEDEGERAGRPGFECCVTSGNVFLCVCSV